MDLFLKIFPEKDLDAIFTLYMEVIMILDYSRYVSEKGHKGLVNYIFTESQLPLFSHKSICPFCKIEINNEIYSKSKHEYPDWLFGSFDQWEEVIQCPNCGWWEYKYQNSSDAIIDGIRASDIEYSSAILKEYDNSSSEVPIEALRKELLRKKDIIYSIDTHKMEELVRSVLADFYPSCKVYEFGKTRDGGKDGILVDDDESQILLQVKRRMNPNSTESVIALRELMGVSLLYDNVKGCIFVTTADHYSPEAKEYAKAMETRHKVETFELIDCKEFLKRIDLTKDCLPTVWETLLKL